MAMFCGPANNALPDEDCQERRYLRCGNFFPEPLPILLCNGRGGNVIFVRDKGKDPGKQDFFTFLHVFLFPPMGRLHKHSQGTSWTESGKPEAFAAMFSQFHLPYVDNLGSADPVGGTILVFDAEVTRPGPEESARVRLGSRACPILDRNHGPYKFFQDGQAKIIFSCCVGC